MSSWASFSSQVKQKGQTPRQTPLPPSKGEKAKQVISTSSSFLGLKAELAERKEAIQQNESRHEESPTSFLGKRDKKLPAYLRPSPDVLARSLKNDQRHLATSSWANTPSSQLDAARQALERKVSTYEKLKSGATGALDEQALQNSLIDWDRKEYEKDAADSEASSDSESDQEIGTANDEEDPMTEYEDDLGRMRRVRRSKVPRSAQRSQQREKEAFDDNLTVYGPSTSFPVFKRREAPNLDERGYKRKDTGHFDAQFEKRYRGAGFYQFSQDEETRNKEMEALRADRDETERRRKSHAHVSDGLSIGERRREERRRFVEEKKRQIIEKRARLAAQAHESA